MVLLVQTTLIILTYTYSVQELKGLVYEIYTIIGTVRSNLRNHLKTDTPKKTMKQRSRRKGIK